MAQVKETIIIKAQTFALAMSEQLYQMRVEDLSGGSIILTDDSEQIPQDFIEKIIDDSVHIAQMKKRIHNSIFSAITDDNRLYYTELGEYQYNSDTYDHAYVIDEYVQEMYESTQTKCVYLCTHCQSDNVQVKAWVRPNEGNLYVDEVNEGDEPGWCDDCNLTTFIETAQLKATAKVIGFQVVGEDGTNEEGEIHPHMDASFCLYSLPQAKAMLDDDNNGEECWRLMSIWTGDVEEPTMMFEGDPRNPEECTASDGTNGSF